MASAAARHSEFQAAPRADDPGANGQGGKLTYLIAALPVTYRDVPVTINRKLADATAGRVRKVMQEAATVYQQTLAETANTRKSLRCTGSGFANALNQFHFLYLDTPHRAAPHDRRHTYLNFLRCRSMVHIAELQRDLYQGTLKEAAEIRTSASKIIG